jgi:hypothetical protein
MVQPLVRRTNGSRLALRLAGMTAECVRLMRDAEGKLVDGRAKHDHGLRLTPQTTFSRTSMVLLMACE